MSDLLMQERPIWNYSLPKKALTKWARENVDLNFNEDGTIDARFLFIGSTCGNMGHSIHFDFHLKLSSLLAGRKVLDAECKPSEKDIGSNKMCAFETDPENFFTKISKFQPLLGETLEQCLEWKLDVMPAGCLCNVQSRNHKWRNAFQTIHYALSLKGEV